MLLNNPHFHVWHHTRDGTEIDGNYGNSLLIWDRLFGTDVTQDKIPLELGITAEQFWLRGWFSKKTIDQQ